MSLNRYRLRHLTKAKHKGAMRANRLLERPDRLIGLILLGNNFVNIAASAITTILALRITGDHGLFPAAMLLTLVILIFAEVTPKTLAALHPERIAFPTSFVLDFLLKIFYYPLVWPISIITNNLLKLFRVSVDQVNKEQLSSDELRTIVNEAGVMISGRHQKMLTSILDLEKVTIDDIMVPRNEIVGIDMNADWNDNVRMLTNTQHTRLPIYEGDANKITGIFHMRRAIRLMANQEFTKENLMTIVRDPYFIPSGTPLNTQLLNFQKQKRRTGVVVDEYGDILGLVTLEDILEEIVGEFTTDPSQYAKNIHPQKDGTYLIDGSETIREINRSLQWNLPTDGPKTLNGLIVEYLETMPEQGISLRIANHTVEIIHTKDNTVKVARFSKPTPDQEPEEEEE